MSEIDWSKLLTIDYWFEGVTGSSSLTPVVEQGSFYFWTYVSVFFAFFTLGVALKVVSSLLNDKNPLQERLSLWSSNLIWIGVIGQFWFTLRQISVGFLGARFWLIGIFVWLCVLIYFVLNYFKKYFKIEYMYYKSQLDSKFKQS